MQSIFANPRASLGVGVAVALAVLVVWVVTAGVDGFGLLSFLVRLVHVLAAMVWIGLVVFVNFVQLVALQSADDQGREFLHKAIVPNVAWWFRHASTLAVVSGALLLVTTGYLLPNLVYGAGVYVPPSRAWLIGAGVLGGLAMWMFVHMYIWPACRWCSAAPAMPTPGTAARVVTFARLNLILAVPVTLAMAAAAHLLTWRRRRTADDHPRQCRDHCCRRPRGQARPLPRRAAEPGARAARASRIGGVLGRDRPRAFRRRQRARHRRDPPAVVARGAGPGSAPRANRIADCRRAASRGRAVRPFPRPARRHDRCALPGRLRRGAGRRRGSARLPVEKRGRAVRPCCPRRGARRSCGGDGPCRSGVRPRLRFGAPAAGVAAGLVAGAHAVAALAARLAGVGQEDLLAGNAGAARCRVARRPARRMPRRPLSRAGDMVNLPREIAPLSFLWPWSNPICGHWNDRAATFCAARSRSCHSCGSTGLRWLTGAGAYEAR
jgi:hypothetical protein